MSVFQKKKSNNLISHILKRNFKDYSCVPLKLVLCSALSKINVKPFAHNVKISVKPVVYLPHTLPQCPSCSIVFKMFLFSHSVSLHVLHAICL